MNLKAKVLKVEVQKNPGFDTGTGNPHPSYFLEAAVLDDEISVRYQCSFRGSLGAERLLKAYRDKLPEAERDRIAGEVEEHAKQEIEGRDITLVVEGVECYKGSPKLLVSYSPDKQDL